MVQGHVDGTARTGVGDARGQCISNAVPFPRELGRYIAMKGSITVDGISLTVAGLESRLV